MSPLMKMRFLVYALGCTLMGERELAELHLGVCSQPPDPEFLAELNAKKTYLKYEFTDFLKRMSCVDPAFWAALLHDFPIL